MQVDPPDSDPPKRKRRWFQFSLRSLLIVVTLAAMACWVIVDRQRLIRERDDALKRLVDITIQLKNADALAKAGKPWAVYEQEELDALKAGIANKK
jgi:hypothetical protein